MLNSRTPIQSPSARFLAGGPEKKHGVILIYPDELTIVAISTDAWAYILGPGAWICLFLPTLHTIGWLAVFLGFLAGMGGGEQVNRWRAARKAAVGVDGVTRVPLDLITGLRTGKSSVLGGWWSIPVLVVTKAVDAAYGSAGRWPAGTRISPHALAARGHDVRVTAGASRSDRPGGSGGLTGQSAGVRARRPRAPGPLRRSRWVRWCRCGNWGDPPEGAVGELVDRPSRCCLRRWSWRHLGPVLQRQVRPPAS